MNNSEVLNRAADAIERDGWTSGSRGMVPGGPHCAMGAIGDVIEASLDESDPGYFAYVPIWHHPATRALADHVAPDRDPAHSYGAITMWNDNGIRDARRIVEAFRAAALIEAAKEKTYDTEDQPLPVEIPASVA